MNTGCSSNPSPWGTAGRRLFADATSPATPRLTETRPFRLDIALLRYRTDWHTKPCPGVRRLP